MGGQGVQRWRDHREADTLLIVVTDGKIAWNAQSDDFDWQHTTCLPTVMQWFDPEEPLYVDIRWTKRRGLPRFRDRRFRKVTLMLLAAITGRAKDEIDSEDICQQRRFKLTAASPRQAAIANPCRTDWRQLRSRQWKRTTAWIGQSHWGRVARTAEAESALRKLQDRISEVATK